MTALTRIEGVAAPLPIANLDTDQIMPKQFLRTITKEGLAAGTLYDLRFDAAGQPRPECVLNQEAYRGCRILIAGPNFGCGSSREHAVWGLQQLGIEAVIAPSYGEIFFGNAMNNRLLLISLDGAAVDALAAEVASPAGNQVSIDLERMLVCSPSGRSYGFSLNARHRQMIVEGLDMVGASLRHVAEIEAFEREHFSRRAWTRVLASSHS